MTTPGIYIQEIEPPAPRKPLGLDIAGFVGAAGRGPLNRPQPISSWGQFREIFGGRTDDAYLGHCVNAYFANGGVKCWVVRVAHESARRARVKPIGESDLKQEGPQPFYFEALNEGEWGNSLRVRVESESSNDLILGELLRDAGPSGDWDPREVLMASASGLARGDDVTLAHRGRTWRGRIAAIGEPDLRGRQAVVFEQPVDPLPAGAKILALGFRLTVDWRQGRERKREVFDNLTAIAGHERYFLTAVNGDPQPRSDAERLRRGLSLLIYASDCAFRKRGWMDRPIDRELTFQGGSDGERPFDPVDPRRSYRYLTGYRPDGAFFHLSAGKGGEGKSECGKDREERSLRASRRRVGLAALEDVSEVGTVAIPDLVVEDWLLQSGPGAEPLPPFSGDFHLLSFDNLKQGQRDMLQHCRRTGDRFAVLDSPRGAEPAGERHAVSDWARSFAGLPESRYGALYYPWLEGAAGDFAKRRMLLPPSGHVAGIYARSDQDRGPGKPPANELLKGAVDLEFCVSHEQQARLNPIGVNCMRSFPGRGLRVWGARTLSPDSRYRYVNVRRLVLAVIKFLSAEMRRFVFEPNDPGLWAAIETSLEDFLFGLFQEGNLAGRSPEEAFFVQCDAETNPPRSIDSGRVIARVGIAPAQPAEFILLTIVSTAESITVQEGG